MERAVDDKAGKRSNNTFQFVNYEHTADVTDRKKRTQVRSQVRSHVTRWQHRQSRERHHDKMHRGKSGTPSGTPESIAVNTRRGKSNHDETPVALDSTPNTGVPLPIYAGQGSSSAVLQDRKQAHDTIGHDDSQQQIDGRGAEARPSTQDAHRLTGDPLTQAFSRGTMSFQTIALQDTYNAIGASLESLHLELPSIMGLYQKTCSAQSRAFARQYAITESDEETWQRFYSFVFSDPILLASAILVGVRNLLAVLGRRFEGQTFMDVVKIERLLVRSINDALGDPIRGVTNQMLMAVSFCASYEIRHGKSACYHMHMQGLVQMINLRGGLFAIGNPDPYTARLLIWTDANTSKIAGCEPYLKDLANYAPLSPQADAVVSRARGVYHP